MKNKTVIICMAALLAAGITPAWGALAPKPAANLFAEQDVGGEKITISQAIQMALEDSYQVIDAVKQKEIYEHQLSAARAGYYPSLSLDGSYSRAIKKARFAMGSGGMVEVVINGKKEITKLTLKPEVVDPEDIEMLQDLVMAGVNEAIRTAETDAQQKMGAITGGMGGPGAPGLF